MGDLLMTNGKYWQTNGRRLTLVVFGFLLNCPTCLVLAGKKAEILVDMAL
jgi:hypothetical protein